jgi:transcriptional regulator with XRE-family HTH domain
LSVAQLLRDQRRAAGLTHEELAERAGVSPRSISELERGGAHIPRRDTVALLVRALGLTGADVQELQAWINRRRRAGLRPASHSAAGAADPGQPVGVPNLSVHNMPRPLDSFVGRERELRELAKLVQTMPLVTLVGEGGVGKTRLAKELARRQLSSQAGTFLVELAGLDDSALLVGAVAAAVGGPDTCAMSSIGGLIQYLRRSPLLLVLDNCEHLVQACAELVAHLLHRCPELHVLATSREPLAIAGEVIWWLPQLECPDTDAITVEQLTRSPAARLFVERARAIIPELRITDATALAVARICRAVDGSPLALELAAARTRALGL